jgi:cytochrome oxidase Cu insertion factor (SCO1/SenC/PrrC family)
MTRLRLLALAIAALALALAAMPTGLAARSTVLGDLMMDLNIAPLDPQAPAPFSVTTLDGGRITLGDVKGRAVLVYFWATW